MSALFVCAMIGAAYVHDGDTIRCGDGTRVRVAGVAAPDFEDAEPCRTGRVNYVCDNAAAERSRRIVERLVLGKRLACRQVDRSYSRVVARCTLPDRRSLSCAIVAAGAAQVWASYWRRYGMEGCR